MNLGGAFKFHLTGFKTEIYIGVHKNRKDAKAIAKALDDAHLEMSKNGELAKLAKKYGIGSGY